MIPHKPKDLTDKEWKIEKRIAEVFFILLGAALFVVIALLIAEKSV